VRCHSHQGEVQHITLARFVCFLWLQLEEIHIAGEGGHGPLINDISGNSFLTTSSLVGQIVRIEGNVIMARGL